MASATSDGFEVRVVADFDLEAFLIYDWFGHAHSAWQMQAARQMGTLGWQNVLQYQVAESSDPAS